MSKVTLEFTLPDEQEAFDDARLGGDYRIALGDIRQHLRALLKYNAEGMDVKTVEAIQERYNEILQEYEIGERV